MDPVIIRLYGTLPHFVAPMPAMHSRGAPRRGVLVSLPIAEKGAAGAHDHRIQGPFPLVDRVRGRTVTNLI